MGGAKHTRNGERHQIQDNKGRNPIPCEVSQAGRHADRQARIQAQDRRGKLGGETSHRRQGRRHVHRSRSGEDNSGGVGARMAGQKEAKHQAQPLPEPRRSVGEVGETGMGQHPGIRSHPRDSATMGHRNQPGQDRQGRAGQRDSARQTPKRQRRPPRPRRARRNIGRREERPAYSGQSSEGHRTATQAQEEARVSHRRTA